jgi:hypothetical protein
VSAIADLIMAGSEGFEPSANGLRGRRSTLLSYEPGRQHSCKHPNLNISAF